MDLEPSQPRPSASRISLGDFGYRRPVTVTAEQWAAAAADLNMTVDELHAKITELDKGDVGARLARHHNLPSLHFDRDGDPLTLGEWAFLFEAPSYKFIRSTILPNLYWIATIWQGINEDCDEPPVVLETGIFHLDIDRILLPPMTARHLHPDLLTALAQHETLVAQWARAHLDPAG